MSCSACSSQFLRSFLYLIDVQTKQVLPKRIVRTSPQRSLHTSRSLYIDSTPTRFLSHEPIDSHSARSLDNVYLPFDSSIRVPLISPIIPLQYSSDASKSDYTYNFNDAVQNKGDRLSLLESPTDDENVTHKSEIRLRNRERPHRTTDVGGFIKLSNQAGVLGRTRHSQSSKQARPAGRSRSFPTTGSKDVRLSRAAGERGGQKAPEYQNAFTPREPWQIQKKALVKKFGEGGWQPRKRLSPDALDGIRALHAQYPEEYSTSKLANNFKVSPEAIRRILKSKWHPSEAEDTSRRDRWQKRGEAIWSQMVELGVKPPKKWREMGIGKLSELHTERSKPRTRASQGGDGLVAFEDVDETVAAISQEGRGYSRRTLSDRIL